MSKGNNRYLSLNHECNNNIIITPTTITIPISHNSDFPFLNPFRTLNIIRTLLSWTSALSIAIILVYAITTIILFNAITTTAELHLLRSRPWFPPPPPPPPPLNLFIATTQINYHFYPYRYHLLSRSISISLIIQICTPCAVIITITVIMITLVIKTTIAMIFTVLLKVLSK